ncbi:MAG: DUF1573 domain-containing protein [Planctomycetes bacterium]|nr:DUF1573 domain-containing protein [Planctomycetota bacterium]
MTKSRLMTLVLLGLGFWAGAPLARAELMCPEPSFNAGSLLAGKPFKHSFVLSNKGKETVQILEALPSCGCLRPKLSQTIITPGEEIALPIEIHTLTKPRGAHRFNIGVRYKEAGEIKELALEVKALIEVEVEVTPAASAIFTDRAITILSALKIPVPSRCALLQRNRVIPRLHLRFIPQCLTKIKNPFKL